MIVPLYLDCTNYVVSCCNKVVERPLLKRKEQSIFRLFRKYLYVQSTLKLCITFNVKLYELYNPQFSIALSKHSENNSISPEVVSIREKNGRHIIIYSVNGTTYNIYIWCCSVSSNPVEGRTKFDSSKI
jgi:hypothetical protein